MSIEKERDRQREETKYSSRGTSTRESFLPRTRELFLRMRGFGWEGSTNYSPPAFIVLIELSSRALIPHFTPGSAHMAQRAETTVDKRFTLLSHWPSEKVGTKVGAVQPIPNRTCSNFFFPQLCSNCPPITERDWTEVGVPIRHWVTWVHGALPLFVCWKRPSCFALKNIALFYNDFVSLCQCKTQNAVLFQFIAELSDAQPLF